MKRNKNSISFITMLIFLTSLFSRKNKFTSKVEIAIELMDPLVENPGDYNILISKFKNDAEYIPIIIVVLLNNTAVKNDLIGGKL